MGVSTCNVSGQEWEYHNHNGAFEHSVDNHINTLVQKKKHIDFPPPVGSDTKVSFSSCYAELMHCTTSRCSFLSVTLSFLPV